MTATREVYAAHDERQRRRRRWRCSKCGADGVSPDIVTALSELLDHDAAAHRPPAAGTIAPAP